MIDYIIGVDLGWYKHKSRFADRKERYTAVFRQKPILMPIPKRYQTDLGLIEEVIDSIRQGKADAGLTPVVANILGVGLGSPV